MVIPLNVRLHHQGRHHGNYVQEQNHVSNKRIRRILTQKNLEVGPQNLRAEPHPATKCHESPEKPGSLIAGSNVRKNEQRCTKEQDTLRQVAESG